MFQRIFGAIRSASHVIAISCLLVLGINAWAYYVLQSSAPTPPDTVYNHVHWPESGVGIEAYEKIFGAGSFPQRIAVLKSSPNFTNHPTLHYITNPVVNDYFHMGIEGIRYESGWDDAKVKSLLEKPSGQIFALGGSTMLGHGLKADETITAVLNDRLAASGATAFNFGSQAYDQAREIDKLLYLLRAGYCPQHVILFDGWNDLAGWPRSNMRPIDRVVWHGFQVGRGEIAFTEGDFVRKPDRLNLFLNSLPIVRLINSRTEPKLTTNDVVVGRDSFTKGFDFREAAFVFMNGADYVAKHGDRLSREMVTSYIDNLVFAHSLSKAFGFTLHAYYQPLGLLDQTNVFVPAAVRTMAEYRFVERLDKEVRAALAARPELAIDLSDSLGSVPAPRYIDIAHYTPAANKALAARMIEDLTKAQPAVTRCSR